jgi:hypothetical protein
MERYARLSTLRLLLALAFVASVAACGGGGGGGTLPGGSSLGTGSGGGSTTSTPAPGASAGPMQTMALTVTIPGKKSAARARGPQYIAPNSGSMTMTLLTVNGVAASGAAQGPFNLTASPTNTACTANPNGTTCTFQISAPVGTDIFLANTYTSSNGTGQSLGSGSVLLSVRLNATNSANLSLTGPVSSVQIVTTTPTLSNGNPPTNSSDSDSQVSVVRSGSPASKASFAKLRRGRLTAQSKRKAQSAGTSVRRPLLIAPAVSPTPPPLATSSRIFVIALDAAGNQIINPTTFDIPINLTLALNGTPAGAVTLTVAYAGLTGEPTSNASTSTDGGVVAVLAPSDQISMTLGSQTSSSVTPMAPTIIASYTPQGGSATTSPPLAYSVDIGPPAAFLTATASHVDPFTANLTATLTMAFGNAGTLPTTGQLEADVFPDGWSYVDDIGSDPSWSCTNFGSIVECFSSAAIPGGGSLPLVFHVNPSTQNPQSNELEVSGGGAINANAEATAVDTINVNSTPLQIAVGNNGQTFFSGVPATYPLNIWNSSGTATSGAVTLVANLPSSPVNFTYSGFSGTGWNCTGSSPTITCTFAGAIQPGNSGSNNVPLTLNVTPPQQYQDATAFNGFSLTGGGNPNAASLNGLNPVQSPIQWVGTSAFPIGTQFGNTFTTGDAATLTFGNPQSSPAVGFVTIETMSGSSGTYNIQSDNCTGPVIDAEFMSQFPYTALGAGQAGDIQLDVNSSGGPLGPCQIVIVDSLNNTATLNVGVAQSNVTVSSYHRNSRTH